MAKKISIAIILITLLLITGCSANEEGDQQKKELIISAASSLTNSLNEIKIAFNKKYPDITITYNFGGSGSLARQLQNGAPADIFLSASETDMNSLEESGVIESSSRFDFVRNSLVLLSPNQSTIALDNLAGLRQVKLEHFVIGDPGSVPAGRYGRQALESAGVWDMLESKLVYVSDVRQVLAQIETGNADAGIVFRTDAETATNGQVVLEIDSRLHDEIIYPAALIKASKNKEAAKYYLDYLKSAEGKAIFDSFGFITK